MHQTKNIADGYLGSGTALNHAIKKHGRDNFQRIILYYAIDFDDMVCKEKELITEKIVLSDDYYNLRIGGQGGQLTEDIKKKIGKKSKKWWSKKSPEERTAHIKNMQRNYTTDYRRKLTTGESNGMYGKTPSATTKTLLREKSAKKDHTVLEWHHNDGRVFIGTMVDFYTSHKLCRAWTSRVRRGIKHTIKGWKFVKELT